MAHIFHQRTALKAAIAAANSRPPILRAMPSESERAYRARCAVSSVLRQAVQSTESKLQSDNWTCLK